MRTNVNFITLADIHNIVTFQGGHLQTEFYISCVFRALCSLVSQFWRAEFAMYNEIELQRQKP